MRSGHKGRYAFRSIRAESDLSNVDGVDLAFYGCSVDERGDEAVCLVKQASREAHFLSYDSENQEIHLENQLTAVERLAKLCSQKKRVLVDATTLGLGEIVNVLLAMRRANNKSISFLYAEPGEYTKHSSDDQCENDFGEYRLTENRVPSGINGFTEQYRSGRKAVHVFMLGFEPGRVQYALEQRSDIGSQHYPCYLVVGLPAFKAGWEAKSIYPHVGVFEQLKASEQSIYYCEASSIREGYLALWSLYSRMTSTAGCFYVSPFGTKPHAVAAALFLVETKGADIPTALYYDHPHRVKGRSRAVDMWHLVNVDM